MLWNRKYQAFDLVVSSVTTKVKGVAATHLPGIGDVVWDVVDYSGSSQVGAQASSLLRTGSLANRRVLKMLFFFSEQKLLLRGDQCHCDEESEAGKMRRGALSSSSSSSLLILLLIITF